MPNWTYKVTRHKANGEHVKQERVIECDSEGSCFVHDLNDAEMKRLNDFFNKHGAQGWELVQCSYHDKEVICVWKKEVERL